VGPGADIYDLIVHRHTNNYSLLSCSNVTVILSRWLGFNYGRSDKVRTRPVQRPVWCAVYSSTLRLVSSQSWCWWICSNL